jgi:heat shock protein HslJ
MARTVLIVTLILAAALSSGCKAKPTPSEGEKPGAVNAPPDSQFGEKPPAPEAPASSGTPTPAGVDWLLLSIEGQPVAPGSPSHLTGLRLDPKSSAASGRAICNQFQGHYDLDDAGLRFGPLATTRMACRGGSQELESKYLKALQDTSRWSRDGERLILKDAAGKTLLEFVAKAVD